MDREPLIAVVQLSDQGESEQPDPLYISNNDVTDMTWQHFAMLLKSLYTNPPDSIRVKYTDDEGDWIELGSDAELREAFKLTQASGEILQLLVWREDEEKLIKFQAECPDAQPVAPTSSREDYLSLSSPQLSGEDMASAPYVVYIPTTDPGGDILPSLQYPGGGILPPLQYPHNTEQITPSVVTPTSPMTQDSALIPAYRLSPAMPLAEAATPTEEPSDPVAQASVGNDKESPQLVNPSAPPSLMSQKEFDQAASLNAFGKLQLLKLMATNHRQQQQKTSHALPLCGEGKPHQQCLGQNSIPNQDPFEVNCGPGAPAHTQNSMTFEEAGQILTPVQALPQKKNSFDGKSPRSSSLSSPLFSRPSTVEVSSPVMPDLTHLRRSVSAEKSDVSKVAATKALYSSTVVPKSKLMKKGDSNPPVPMPRNLLMMEGAQSGANAVAIEMPSESEVYDYKDGEIIASGGTSSTSASEETGEILSSSPGASVAACMEVKTEVKSESSTASGGAVTLIELRDLVRAERAAGGIKSHTKKANTSSKTGAKCEDIKVVKKTECCGVGARPKTGEKKSKKKAEAPLSKRKSMEKQEKKKDEESGETATCCVTEEKKNPCNFKYDDFVKHMKKVKKDLHASIVKDVTRQTEKLLQKNLSSRSGSESQEKVAVPSVPETSEMTTFKDQSEPVIHKRIRCDRCDQEIVGVRFKCGNCPDFDLCGQCENGAIVHDPTHVFLKLRIPARKAGCVGKERVPLLRENIYDAEIAWEQKRQKAKEAKKKTSRQDKADREEKKKVEDEKEKLNKDYQNEKTSETETICKKYEEIPVYETEKLEDKINKWTVFPTPADTHLDLFEDCQEKINIQIAEDLQAAITKAFEQKVEKTETKQYQQMEDFEPVNRERFDSNSSGSSIVRLSPPLPIILPDQSSQILSVSDTEESPRLDDFKVDETTQDLPLKSADEKVIGDVTNVANEARMAEEDQPEEDDEDDDDAQSLLSGSSYEYFLSDDSEEFCILAHPAREGYEDLGQDAEEAKASAPLEEHADATEELPSAGSEVNAAESKRDEEPEPCEASVAVSRETDENGNEAVEVSRELPQTPTEHHDELHWANLVHQLSDKEKEMYQEILQTELNKEKLKDEEYCELVKIQAEREEAERARTLLKVSREEDYKDILQVKALQASIVNKQLEENRKAVAASNTSMPTANASSAVEEQGLLKETARKEEQAVYSIPLRDRQLNEYVSQILELEGQKFAALNAGDQAAVALIEERLKDLDKIDQAWRNSKDNQSQQTPVTVDTPKEDVPSVGVSSCLSRQTSVMSTGTQSPLSVDTCSATSATDTKDADCQTVPEPGAPALHIIQNVASGVSKAASAASTAFSTAKDVFYSLQAKQAEKKTSDGKDRTSSSGWQPKTSAYIPPQSNWKPTQSMWTPKESKWTPSKDYDDYTPPVSTWTPPDNVNYIKTQSQQNDTTQKPEVAASGTDDQSSVDGPRSISFSTKKGSNASLTSSGSSISLKSIAQTSPIDSINITDSALRREILGMQRLIEMGFANREKNRQLLAKFDGDLERVVQSLLQEEGEDHWAFNRH